MDEGGRDTVLVYNYNQSKQNCLYIARAPKHTSNAVSGRDKRMLFAPVAVLYVNGLVSSVTPSAHAENGNACLISSGP